MNKIFLTKFDINLKYSRYNFRCNIVFLQTPVTGNQFLGRELKLIKEYMQLIGKITEVLFSKTINPRIQDKN